MEILEHYTEGFNCPIFLILLSKLTGLAKVVITYEFDQTFFNVIQILKSSIYLINNLGRFNDLQNYYL